MSKLIDAVLGYRNQSNDVKEEILKLLVEAILGDEESEFFNGDTWCFSLSRNHIKIKRKLEDDWHIESTKDGFLKTVDSFDEIECAVVFGGDYNTVVDLLIDYSGILK